MIDRKYIAVLSLFIYMSVTIFHTINAFANIGLQQGEFIMILTIAGGLTMFGLCFVKDTFLQQACMTIVIVLSSILICYQIQRFDVMFLIYLVGIFSVCAAADMKSCIFYLAVTDASMIFSYLMFTEIVNQTLSLHYYSMFFVFINAGMMAALFLVHSYRKQMVSIEEHHRNLVEEQKSKDDFLANISHEIRSPMNAVCGMAELILREENISDSTRESAGSIQRAGKGLLGIINDILDFSKIQSGKMDIYEEPYYFASMINDIVSMSTARKANKRIEILLDIDPLIPEELIGDEKRIKQIILNFVTNGIKFTECGSVTISVSQERKEDEFLLKISVKDTGIGIEKENMDKLFHSFSQVNTKKNRNMEGTGLGLAISRQLVEQMQGTIEVESIYGEGSEFTFIIPQKVKTDTPFITLKESEGFFFLAYFNRKKTVPCTFGDQFVQMFEKNMKQLNLSYALCHSLTELKQYADTSDNKITHVFVTAKEFREEPAYYERLARAHTVIVAREQIESIRVGKSIRAVYLPISVMTIAHILNSDSFVMQGYNSLGKEGFIAPDAKILVVDDNYLNLKVAKGLLEPYQVQLTLIESGEQALETVLNDTFDLILMDHMMPGMDGVETVRQIRKNGLEWCKTVPVIALTANAVSGVRDMFQAEGFQGFVSKPIELREMERALRQCLPAQLIVEKETSTFEIPQNHPSDLKSFRSKHLDTELGLCYIMGDERIYFELLSAYLEDAEQNMVQIKNACAEGDLRKYRVFVHALKSNSLSIGAKEFSEFAKSLEDAAVNKNLDMVKEKTPELLTGYETIVEEIKRLFSETGYSKKET